MNWHWLRNGIWRPMRFIGTFCNGWPASCRTDERTGDSDRCRISQFESVSGYLVCKPQGQPLLIHVVAAYLMTSVAHGFRLVWRVTTLCPSRSSLKRALGRGAAGVQSKRSTRTPRSRSPTAISVVRPSSKTSSRMIKPHMPTSAKGLHFLLARPFRYQSPPQIDRLWRVLRRGKHTDSLCGNRALVTPFLERQCRLAGQTRFAAHDPL